MLLEVSSNERVSVFSQILAGRAGQQPSQRPRTGSKVVQAPGAGGDSPFRHTGLPTPKLDPFGLTF